ncbi:MAG: hypothetical protein HY369_05590 [Candidatus Aenigmarchaeota archaeon]|nr:hypothetical protein [Candidatus Aenigmarchaeota archaeon]
MKAPREPQARPQQRRVLVVGLDRSERDVIVDMTLKGSRKALPPITRVRLPRLRTVADISAIGLRRRTFIRQLESLIADKANVVISGSLVSPTGIGYIPLLEAEFLARLQPDLVILLETDTRELFYVPGMGIARHKDPQALEAMRFEQDLNRHWASRTGSPVAVLRLEKGNAKRTLRELRQLLVAVMG